KLQEQIIKTAAEFGLTPRARSSVKVNKQQQLDLLGADAGQKEENDPYANFSIRSS
ncbi:P27 family phage terminase small subunit, partial [Acinetobacter baumannii]